MELLPDLLESVARLRVKVGGTFKGARREVNFTSSDASVTITGTDDSVNERMTVDLVAGGSGALTNSWLTAYSTQYVFVDNSAQSPSFNLLASQGSDIAIDGGDNTIINILTDGYYEIHVWGRIYQTAVTSTTVALLIFGVSATLADTASLAYNFTSGPRIVVPAAYPQNWTIAAESTTPPFKAEAGDTIGGIMWLFGGTVGNDFTFDSEVHVVKVD